LVARETDWEAASREPKDRHWAAPGQAESPALAQIDAVA